ncbi:glycosyltransferase [Flavobacterium sp.]|uniref:glycosyltransferase n=1 Tax=Flavobacterium sp. TaxID=239 RepID=UPI0037509915
MNILVAPLNWGLGHATRCIPIINALLDNGFNPILASDGTALTLLKKEFPNLLTLELPSYNVEYAKKASNFKWKIIKNSPKTINAILQEKKIIKSWIKEYNLLGIISDNRLGVHSKKVPSVFITHQLTVLSGRTTYISSKVHQFFIKKFNECWVPDYKDVPNLTGKLGHLKDSNLNLKYIGILSRLEKQQLPLVYDLMILLSGPEPQRTLLEEKLIIELENYNQKVVFIKGKIEAQQIVNVEKNITFYNYMQTKELEKTINESEIVLCRSGYTTIMDLAKLEKKAFFIPTPGQFEQEYLAKRLKKQGLVPTAKQDKFKLENLNEIPFYKGLNNLEITNNWAELFSLFQA